MSEPMHILSLGAGVQSSTLALMAAAGEVTPMPAAAIFADTGAEPRRVYDWLAWLEERLPFPVHRVMWKDGITVGMERTIASGGQFVNPPFYTSTPDGKREGQVRRQCTREYKIQPIERKIRELLGLAKGQRGPRHVAVVTWQGISTDEIQRARKGIEGWQQFRYPLIEARMSRTDCLRWMADRGFPTPPKSACIWCPYHDDRAWREMRDNDPESWAEAMRVDSLVRDIHERGVGGIPQRLYVHRSLVPLAEVDLSTPADHGQTDLFEQECEGMCGL
jgi:hypothetical protein